MRLSKSQFDQFIDSIIPVDYYIQVCWWDDCGEAHDDYEIECLWQWESIKPHATEVAIKVFNAGGTSILM